MAKLQVSPYSLRMANIDRLYHTALLVGPWTKAQVFV